MEILDFFKDYAAIVNIAILISFLVILFRLFNTYKAVKEAEINVIKVKNKNNEMFLADNVNRQMNNLKEWHNESMRQLEIEKEKAFKSKEIELQKRIESEIHVRNELKEKFNNTIQDFNNKKDIAVKDIIGEYSISGKNPGDISKLNSYFGELTISLENNEIKIFWSINKQYSKQTFRGVGVLYGNQLSVYFRESNALDNFHGVISYKFLSNEILRGKWTGMGSGGLYGYEECRKIDKSTANSKS